MIELLIVIGVLGILATGLLAAVDPFEQLKKARDTNNRQAAVSLQTAFIRYYATHGQLPWDLDPAPTDCPLTILGTDRKVGVNITTLTNCITLLENDGELKTGFVAALGAVVADDTYVTSASKGTLQVCFVPASKSIWNEENTKYDKSGTDLTTATTPTCDAAWKTANPTSIATTCHLCAK